MQNEAKKTEFSLSLTGIKQSIVALLGFFGLQVKSRPYRSANPASQASESESLPSGPLQTTRSILGLFGLDIKSNQYFNTGKLTPLQENSQSLYDAFYADKLAVAQYYAPKGYRLEFYRTIAGRMIKEGIVLDGKSILEVGCGVGYLLSHLRKTCDASQLSGCDFSNEAIEVSKSMFPEIHFFQHSIYEALPQKHDIILCIEVLEHLEKPFVALKNISNALRPGGSLVMTVPNGRTDTAIEHLNFWSPESWKIFLERECLGAKVRTATLFEDRINFAVIQFP